MAKQYDATIKTLVETFPVDWLKYAGLPIGETVEVVDADVSSITAAADKVLRVTGPRPYIGHIEFQAGPDPAIDQRTMFYNVVLGWRHRLPVRSVVVLLRPQADHESVKGEFVEDDGAGGLLHFRYRLIRLWQQPPEQLLTGGLGTLPLAPISNVRDTEFPEVFEQVWRRLQKEVRPPQAIEGITATAILAGLRQPDDIIERLLSGVAHMEESSFYQAILRKGLAKGEAEGRAVGLMEGCAEGHAAGRAEGRDEGRAEGRAAEARSMLFRVAGRRFGPPPPVVAAQLESITEVDQIEQLVENTLIASNWDELLQSAKKTQH